MYTVPDMHGSEKNATVLGPDRKLIYGPRRFKDRKFKNHVFMDLKLNDYVLKDCKFKNCCFKHFIILKIFHFIFYTSTRFLRYRLLPLWYMSGTVWWTVALCMSALQYSLQYVL